MYLGQRQGTAFLSSGKEKKVIKCSDGNSTARNKEKFKLKIKIQLRLYYDATTLTQGFPSIYVLRTPC